MPLLAKKSSCASSAAEDANAEATFSEPQSGVPSVGAGGETGPREEKTPAWLLVDDLTPEDYSNNNVATREYEA